MSRSAAVSSPSPRQIKVEQTSYKKGYVSFFEDSIAPADSFIEGLNMDLVMDSRPRPRPSTVQYGSAFLGECIGIETFTRVESGKPKNYEISMQIIGGVGNVCIRSDGGTWTTIGGSYATTHWVDFTQGNNRVMISNKINDMSYLDIPTLTIISYTSLPAPAAPTITVTGLTGTADTTYLRYTAENDNGETARSAATTYQTSKVRDQWVGGTSEYVTYNGTAVAGAKYYNWYIGSASGQERHVATTNAPTYRDDGTAQINPVRRAPIGDSTKGPILGYMWYAGGKFYGVDDKDNPSYVWYSGDGLDAGSWSPFLGGGYVAIDYGGNTVPIGGLAYRDGKGTAAITVLSKGAAGAGQMNHIVFQTQVIGDTPFIYPEVYPANGQAGASGSRCIAEANNGIYYLTGLDIKTTNTMANMVNILVQQSVSTSIDKDVRNLNLAALDKACNVEFENAIYWAVPNGSDENNQIWKLDLARGNVWVLPWTIAAKHLWKYEDSDGNTHLLALVNNKSMEFTRMVLTQDDGVPFPTRFRSVITWDKTGQSIADIESATHKLLHPIGNINASASGLDEDLMPTGTLAGESFTQTVDVTGWNEAPYNELAWNQEYGVPQSFAQSVGYIRLEPDESLNQLELEITTNDPSDYILASTLTRGDATNEYIGD